MARVKRVSRKEKRRASSTHSSQDDDSRPRKAPKQDENNSESGSSIQMINSSNLKRYRKNQRQREQQQQPAAQGRDDGTNPPGIRPPPGNGLRRRPQEVPQPSPEEEEEQEYEGEFETSYGGNDSEERDQRISGWAGSVAGAGAGDPNAGVEYDEASVQSSSPSAPGAAQGEDDEEDATEEENAIPSIENGNARPSAGAVRRARATVPAQRPNQTLRRSARLLRQNPQVSMARIPEMHFDPVAHLNKTGHNVRDLLNKTPRAPAGVIACTAADFKARRQAFFDGPRPHGYKAVVKPFNRGNFESLGRVLEGNGVAIKSNGGGYNNTIDAVKGANKQGAAVKYFGRDQLTNHGYILASNSENGNSNESSSHDVSDAQPFPNGDYNSNEISTCAFAACPCHRATAPGLTRRYVIHVPGGAWVFHPTREHHHDRDYFPGSGYEQHNLDYGSEPREDRDYFPEQTCLLDYGSEPREDRDYFPMQVCVLDYDGDAQLKEEPASEAGDYTEEDDGADDNGEAGSAGGDSPDANESGAYNGSSDDEDPDGEEREVKPKPSDSGSDNSDEDSESEESGQGSEDPVASEDENMGEDDSAAEDESDSESGSDYAELQPNNNTPIIRAPTDPWGRIRPPQTHGIPPSPPRVTFPSAPLYYVPTFQSGNLGPRRDGTTTALYMPNYDMAGRIRPPQNPVPHLARRGGLPDTPFAGPQTRQNTAANRMRDQPLSPGQGYVSVSIAEQQAAQMLHAYEGVDTVEGEDGEGEGEQDEGHEAENGDAENDDVGDGEAAGYDGDEE